MEDLKSATQTLAMGPVASQEAIKIIGTNGGGFFNANSAHYFAIIPAIFVTTYPQLTALNVMRLASPSSAILSAVIFNALIIVFLIPLALKGVKYRAIGASALLRRNLLVYGLGGLIVPFVGIKVIDLVLASVGLV